MKKSILSVALVLMVLLSYNSALAATVYEDTGVIQGEDGSARLYVADTSPFTYLVTLSDISTGDDGFKDLNLALLDFEGIVDSLNGPGNFIYDAVEGRRYWVFVFGEGDGPRDVGEYGVTVEAVPIPAAILLLGGGLIGLLGLRRRIKS